MDFETVNALPAKKLVCDSLCHSKFVKTAVQPGLPTQVKEFFLKLFNTADWPPRWHCGTWTDFHGWLYIFSDTCIWAAYFAIPVLLFRILNKRKDLPFPKIIWLFIAFILLCGTTHLLDAIIFWWPAYRLSALVRFATAVVSVITVCALYRILPLIYQIRTQDQLEAEIEERKKAELESRNAQIKQQAAEDLLTQKDEFISIASHELKTPITSVKAYLQLLQRMVEKNTELQPAGPFVDKANKQVEKLTLIVSDLLDMTKIQAGKLELAQTDFNLMDMVKEAIEQCQVLYNTENISIDGDEKLTMHGDRTRLDQVVSNFLTNAFKYSPENDHVKISFARQGNGKVRVSVTDFGIGIPAGHIENIFDRFYRVENTSQNFAGVGLGLYISAEIIRRHGGEIGVNSELGKGSEFWFEV